MIRRLALLAAPLGLLALSACDVPQALTKAKEGDCFAVVGKEPGGAPKWEKTECATDSGAVVTAIGEQPADGVTTNADGTTATASGATTTKPGACPAVPLVCPPATRTASASTTRSKSRFWNRKSKSHREVATRSNSRSHSRSSQARSGEYERVYTPDYPPAEPLLGPPSYREETYSNNNSYNNRSDDSFYREDRRYSYNPPAPPPPPAPAYRYEQREQQQSYGYGSGSSSSYGHRVAPLPPAPVYDPPPVYRAPPPPPPIPCRTGCPTRSGGYASQGQSGYRAEYSETERRSYSASSSSSGGSYGGGSSSGCNSGCGGGRGSTMAPMNGPHFPVDQDGYLTWRGKTR